MSVDDSVYPLSHVPRTLQWGWLALGHLSVTTTEELSAFF